MAGSVYRIGTKVIFTFSYSKSLNAALKAASEHRVRWDPGLRSFTLAVSDLEQAPRLRTSLNDFITTNGFDANAGVRALLREDDITHGPGSGSVRIGPGRLTADLLPETTWGSNLRGVLNAEDWDRLRIPVCTRAADRCEVCAAQCRMPNGRRRRPDCHELWTFGRDGRRQVQRLDRLIALCPDCHRVQHMGRAEVRGELELVVSQLRRVNEWTAAQAREEIDRATRVFEQRRLVDWDLDLSLLAEFIEIDGFPDLRIPAADRVRLGNSFYD